MHIINIIGLILILIFLGFPALVFWVNILGPSPENGQQWGMYSFKDILVDEHQLTPVFKLTHNKNFRDLSLDTIITEQVTKQMIERINNFQATNPEEYLNYMNMVGYMDYILHIMISNDWSHPSTAIYKEILNARFCLV